MKRSRFTEEQITGKFRDFGDCDSRRLGVIPGTLATEFRDFGDRDSGRLGVILGTLATKLIGDTNNFPISLGR
jgi:hypothetical protein